MKPVFILTFFIFFVVSCQPVPDDKQTLSTDLTTCTKEAKICPDGSLVKRNPKNDCEFDLCPVKTQTSRCQQKTKKCPDGSYVFSDPSNQCKFQPCPSELEESESSMFCTQDVAQCSDGSYVGRDPKNNCEFKPCPDGSQPRRSKTRLD